MKKINIILAIVIISCLCFIVVTARNNNKFEDLNAELSAVDVEPYSKDGFYVRFETLIEMQDTIDATIEKYNSDIIAMQEELVEQINNSKSFSEMEYLIADISNVDANVTSTAEYDKAIAELNTYADEITKVENAHAMSYFINDTKDYLVNNFTPEELETISIGLINLETKEEIYFNENFLFYSASTIKVPINMYMYDLIAQGEVALDDTITYTEKYYEGGTGVMQNDPIGTVYTIDEILTQSIVSSDNVATNMLIFNYFEDPGNLTSELEPYWGYCNLDYNSSRECSVTNHINSLNYLYDHSSEYELLIQDMKDSIYKDMIPKYIDVEVANKVGMDGSILIDDAIVYASTPYAISIAFVGIDNAEERMALLSEEIYNNWNEYMN